MKELNTFRQFLAEGVIKEEQISPDPLYDMGYSAGEKAVMALSTELFNQPYFDQYADGFIKGFQDNVRASQDYAANSVAEGEIKEDYKNDIKEDEDYDTGGYVEAMNPELFDHIDEVIRIFKEWKDGPMTEPGMEGYAKDDLVDYIQMKIRNA